MLVTEIDTDALFAPLAGAKGILLALSGGPDSVAALALLSTWAKTPHRPKLFAATFDHALRATSRAEAEQCATLCKELGVPHTILTWIGEKPSTRIQEEARDARYAALLAHAKATGADHLITAHHADDQMETILFRIMRGSSIGGLAGMRASIERQGIIHARPFLSLRKSDLVAFCVTHGLKYISDPSNEDPRFARTQMRKLAAPLEAAGLGPEIFARLALRAARAEQALDQTALALAQTIHQARDDQATSLDGKALLAAPAEIGLRVFMAEIARLGQAPRLEQAEVLMADLLMAHRHGRRFRATLGGTLIDLKSDSRLVITREPPRKTGL